MSISLAATNSTEYNNTQYRQDAACLIHASTSALVLVSTCINLYTINNNIKINYIIN